MRQLLCSLGLGQNDTMISTIDLDGIALAAIQGLAAITEEQALAIKDIQGREAALQARLDGLEARTAALEAGPGGPVAGRYLPWAGLALLAVGLVWTIRRRGGV